MGIGYDSAFISEYVLTGGVLVSLFLILLIIGRTMNQIISYQARVEFLLKTEYKYKSEELEVHKALAQAVENIQNNAKNNEE